VCVESCSFSHIFLDLTTLQFFGQLKVMSIYLLLTNVHQCVCLAVVFARFFCM